MAEERTERTEDDWVTLLRAHAEAGTVLDLAPGLPDGEIDTADGAHWPAARSVPAAAVRRLLLLEDLRPDPRGLQVRGARLRGALDLRFVTAPCHLRLSHCVLQAVNAGRSRLVSLDLRDSRVERLALDGAHVDGELRLDGLTATGGVRGMSLRVGGQLNLVGAALANDAGRALNLDGLDVAGGVRLDRLTAHGEIRAVGATVAGQLSMDEAELTNPTGPALVLSRIQVEGSVFLRGLAARGEVRALAARISGQLALRRATLVNRRRNALILDRTQVVGSIHLTGTSVHGRTSLRGTRISSQLSLADVTLDNGGGDALSAERLHVTGGMTLSGARARGRLSADGATVAGGLVLDDASLTNGDGDAVSLAHAQLAVLRLHRPSIAGGLDLRYATIGVLDVTQWRPERLTATGWQVRAINGPPGRSWRAARDWLDAADSSAGFVRQPWQEVAAVLDRAGHPEQGRRLLLEAERRVTRHSRWWSTPVRWGYGALAGYGLYPLVSGAWLLVAALLTLGLAAAAPAHFAPTDLEAALGGTGLAAATGASPCTDLAAGHPCFSPVVYGLEVMLPVAQIGQVAAWAPQPTPLAAAIVVLRAFVWLMTALLLAGVTGLLRRR